MTRLLTAKLPRHAQAVGWIGAYTSADPAASVRRVRGMLAAQERAIEAGLMDPGMSEEAFKAVCRAWMEAWRHAVSEERRAGSGG